MFDNSRYEDGPHNSFLSREKLERGQAEAKLRMERGEPVSIYYISSSSDVGILAMDVNKKLKDGFRLWGPLVVDNRVYLQAMVK